MWVAMHVGGLFNVTSPYVEADGAIIINCAEKMIVAPKGCILYNLIDMSDEGIVAIKY